jgi:hypothetical protein
MNALVGKTCISNLFGTVARKFAGTHPLKADKRNLMSGGDLKYHIIITRFAGELLITG